MNWLCTTPLSANALTLALKWGSYTTTCKHIYCTHLFATYSFVAHHNHGMNIKTCLEHCKLLRPVWTLTYQHCTRPTICSTAHPPSTEDVYYNNDVCAKCLQKLDGDDLKCVYDYIKTEVSILTNVVYICKYLGVTHRIYSSESQSLAYLLGIIRHQRRGQFITNI